MVKQSQSLTLLEVYQGYIQARKVSVRPGTWRNGYKVMLGHIERSPFAKASVTDSGLRQRVLDWSRTNLTPDTAKRFCVQLNAAVNWAIDLEITQIEKSPFEGLAKKLRSTKADLEISSFSKTDCERIIEYFTINHFHYSDFIKFLFWTGCRPSEALALKWEDVAKDFSKVTFASAIVVGDGGLIEVNGLKTQKKRSFPCNERLRSVLKTRFTQSHKGYVFTGQSKNVPLNLGYVRKLWRKCLIELGIEHQMIYQTRHTFITFCLGSGISVQDVARLVGNSPTIIYQHYAGVSKVEIPEF